MKILHADNNKDWLETVDWFLVNEGYEVVKALSPQEAEKKFLEEKPNLAIFDLRMINDSDDHDQSGLSLARKLAGEVPIIMMSGSSAPSELPTNVVWLGKGEEPQALLDLIAQLIK